MEIDGDFTQALLRTIGVYMRVSTPFLRSFKFSCLSFHTTRSLYLSQQIKENHYRGKAIQALNIHISAERKGVPEFNSFKRYQEAAGL